MRALGRRYRCITFDARGYPPSDVPEDPGAYSQDAAIDDVLAVLDTLGIVQRISSDCRWGDSPRSTPGFGTPAEYVRS